MIRLGPGGTDGLGYVEGLKRIHELGLNAMEVEFTYGVRMKNDDAKEVGALAKKYDIALSVHGPYYINLASLEKEKIAASKVRILDSCEKANHLGATHVVFHAGFYQKRTKEETYDLIKEQISELLDTIKSEKWKVELALETTGKASQFGDLDELLSLRKETGSNITVDFSHLLARTGSIDYDSVFSKLKKLKHIHSHFSGIEYTAKGERRHLLTETKRIKELVSQVLKRNVDITIINESPDPIGDSVRTKKIIENG